MRYLSNPYTLIALTLISSFLLVTPLRLFALKFKNFSWADNKVRYAFLTLSAMLLIIFRMSGIPLIIVLYIILSITNNLINQHVSPAKYE
jgi:CDP-diacylglycerol--serine O-phosphatidyltransferase